MKKVLVLDAPAFIGGCQAYEMEECYTSGEVISEIKNKTTRLKTDLSIKAGTLIVAEPPLEYVEEVERTAGKSGDIALLSKTDLKLLALALYKKKMGDYVAIVTDDYDIQNVASILEIEFLPISERGIKKVLRWKNICKGCGKKYPIKYERKCDVCGSDLRIVRG